MEADPILVVGPGAMGGALAARWDAAGKDVLLLGRDPASERRIAAGFLFTGLDGITRQVGRGLRAARSSPRRRAAAAFFCVKNGDTARAAAAARPWIGPHTAVVGLQNGLGHERVLRRAFGPARTVLGTAFFAADRPRPGFVTNSWGNNVLLACNPDNGAAVAAAQSLLLEGGWEVSLKSAEDRLLWTKACFNAATNPLGALCAVTNGVLAEEPPLRQLMLAALREAVGIARAAGHRPIYHDMEALVVRSCRNAPRQRNSMLQDLSAGRPTEIGEIAGPILAAGRRHARPAPTLARLSAAVRRLERELSR